MSDIVDACKAQARGRGKRVVFPEGHDERIVAAARRLQDEQIAQPILLGTAAEIEAAATRAQVSIEGLTTRDPQTSDRLAAYASLYYRPALMRTKDRGRLVRKPLFHAGMMVKAQDADAMIAGVANATGRSHRGRAHDGGAGARHAHAIEFFPDGRARPRRRAAAQFYLRGLRGECRA